MMCVLCLAAFERRQFTGAYDIEVEGVTDRPLAAAVVFAGRSLCSRHFNTVRGKPADFLQYEPEGCEYMVPMAEDNPEMCDRPSVGYVGVDDTPYCEFHIHEMRTREAAST